MSVQSGALHFELDQPAATQQPIITKGFIDNGKILQHKRNANDNSGNVYPHGSDLPAQAIMPGDLCFFDINRQVARAQGAGALSNHPDLRCITALNGERVKNGDLEAASRMFRFAGVSLANQMVDPRFTSASDGGFALQMGGVVAAPHKGYDALRPGDMVEWFLPALDVDPDHPYRGSDDAFYSDPALFRPQLEGHSREQIPFPVRPFAPYKQVPFVKGIAALIKDDKKVSEVNDTDTFLRRTDYGMSSLKEEAVGFKLGLLAILGKVADDRTNNNNLEASARKVATKNKPDANDMANTHKYLASLMQLKEVQLMIGAMMSATNERMGRCIGRSMTYVNSGDLTTIAYGSH